MYFLPGRPISWSLNSPIYDDKCIKVPTYYCAGRIGYVFISTLNKLKWLVTLGHIKVSVYMYNVDFMHWYVALHDIMTTL